MVYVSPFANWGDLVHSDLPSVHAVGILASTFDLKPALNVLWLSAVGVMAAYTSLQCDLGDGGLERRPAAAIVADQLIAVFLFACVLVGLDRCDKEIVRLDLEGRVSRSQLGAARA